MKILIRIAVAGMLSLLHPSVVRGQECPEGTVSEIVFERLHPFLPATDDGAGLGGLFRSLNRLHVRTRPAVLRWELLIGEGECLDARLLEESARSLRSLPYIVEASVTSEPLGNGLHRVKVRTRDGWALRPGVAVTFDDGFRVTGASFHAGNVLGTGTQAGLFRNVYRERSRIGLIGRQPNVFGTRVDATVHGGTTRSGKYVAQSLFRPYAGEGGAHAFRQGVELRDDYFLYSVDPALGFTKVYLRFEAEAYEATYQRRFGNRDGTRLITGLGLSREVVRFPFGADGGWIVRDGEFDDPVPAPVDVLEEIARHANRYATNRVNFTLGVRDVSITSLTGVDALRATQDVLTGIDLTVTVAPSLTAGDDNGRDTFLHVQASFGTRGSAAYLLFDADAQARRVHEAGVGGARGWRDFLYEVNGNGYWNHGGRAQTFGRVQLAAGHRWDRPFQLTLGGREAVRAYDEDAYPGARRALVTVEHRLALPTLSSGLADVGVAVFADAGKMWGDDVPFGRDTEWKAGIGAGLRLGFPAGSPSVLRIDVGAPLTGDRDALGTVFRVYAELLGVLDRRSWPSQTDRSRWYGIQPDLSTRPVHPLAGN